MIISDEIIWLHLPKTAGSSLNQVFNSIGNFYVDDDLELDEYGISIKHDSIERREKNSSWRYEGQKKFINCRRLPDWLLSDYLYKTSELNINYNFNYVRSGRVKYQLRLNGEIRPADWWLEYFKINDVTAIRMEFLEEDLNKKLVPYLKGIDEIKVDVKINCLDGINKNVLNYFSPEDIEVIYENNPIWKKWEKEVYGNTYLELL